MKYSDYLLVASTAIVVFLAGMQYEKHDRVTFMSQKSVQCTNNETHVGYIAFDGISWKCVKEQKEWPHKTYVSIMTGADE